MRGVDGSGTAKDRKGLWDVPATQGTAPFVERPGSWIDTGNNIEAKNQFAQTRFANNG